MSNEERFIKNRNNEPGCRGVGCARPDTGDSSPGDGGGSWSQVGPNVVPQGVRRGREGVGACPGRSPGEALGCRGTSVPRTAVGTAPWVSQGQEEGEGSSAFAVKQSSSAEAAL